MSKLNEFSVTQFFAHDVGHETVRKHVSMEEALRAFAHYTGNPASRIGITQRVIITDGGYNIVMEWKHGKGIVWPPKQV